LERLLPDLRGAGHAPAPALVGFGWQVSEESETTTKRYELSVSEALAQLMGRSNERFATVSTDARFFLKRISTPNTKEESFFLKALLIGICFLAALAAEVRVELYNQN